MTTYDPTHRDKRFLGKELLLWLFASIVGVATATSSTYVVGSIVGLSTLKLLTSVCVIGVLSITWGSWAALLWTRRTSVRNLLKLSTQAPALWMLFFGGAILWGGKLTLSIVFILLGGGAALAIASQKLSATIHKLDHRKSGPGSLLLSILHPILTSFAVAGFLLLWLSGLNLDAAATTQIVTFDPQTFLLTMPDLLEWITRFTWHSVIAISLVSTIVPAFIAEVFSRFLCKCDSYEGRC